MRRECISDLRHDIYGRDPLVVREVIASRHGLTRVDIELSRVTRRSAEKEIQIVRSVAGAREAEACTGPSVFVLDACISLFPEDIVEVDRVWMARVRHAVVAYKDDINDLCQIPGNELCVQVPRKTVNVLKCVLWKRIT